MTICANGSRTPSGSARCATSRARAGRRTSGSPPRRSCAPRTAPASCSTTFRAARRASALLLNMFAGTRRNMTLGFPDHLTKWELSDAYREAYLKEPEDHPARDRRGRPGVREHHDGRRHRRDEISLADLAREGRRPLHRHRHLQHHPRSRRRTGSTPAPIARRCTTRTSVGIVWRAGHHGCIHREKYFKRGEPMPVAMVLGGDPLAFFYGGVEAPYGMFEIDIVGGMRGRPIKMVRGKVTGLPFPANAEIVLEGYVTPDKRHDRRPVRRMDRPLRRRRAHDAGARHQGDLSPQRSDPARRAADGRGARRDGALPRRDALGHRSSRT